MAFLFWTLWGISRNCFVHTVPQVRSTSSSGAVVRLSSWVQMLRCLFTLARVWEQRWKQQESGRSRYWKNSLRETLPCLASLSLGPGPVLRDTALSPYPMTSHLLLYFTPIFRGIYLLRWNSFPWKCWSRKQDANKPSWACFLDWYPYTILSLN